MSKTKLPIDKLEEEYTLYEGEFNSTQIDDEEKVILKNLQTVLDALHEGDSNVNNITGFESWTGNKLILAEEKLNRFSELLGDKIAYHEVRSDFAYIWRKNAYATDWLPMKTKLKNELTDKVTNSEVESCLLEKYSGEQFYSMFHRRRADYLLAKIDSVKRILITIAHRLKELERQQNLNQDSQ